jgi:serine/threonine protein kinase
MEPNVIGEGTYGCVHKPSLKCKSKKVDYTNKVSKLMTKKHATIEMGEYKKIQQVDKSNKFYLGNPVSCVPENDDSAKQAVNMCARFKGNSIKDYNLLIMNDGGNNLEQYANKMTRLPKTDENIDKIERFWIEAQRILLGLKVFNDNGIVHHDLKPQNIVYNEDKNRTNFIDFGLMTTMDEIRNDSSNSKYRFGKLHWSFPLEMEYVNKKHYLQIAQLTSTEKEKTHKKFFIERAQSNDKVKTFLHYVLPINSNIWDEMCLNSYNFIVKDINENNYNEFLERVIRTIDIYGTGIAFMYILNKTSHLIEPNFASELRTLFYNMINPNVFMRYMPEQVLNEFEKILLENGILTKYGKHFENHILISNENVNIAKVNEIIKDANNIDISIDKEKVNRISNSTPTKINRISSIKPLKACPDGKERNPLTRRCVNVCKYGYIRNAEFKCVRDKTIKLTKTRKTIKTTVEQNTKPLLFFR